MRQLANTIRKNIAQRVCFDTHDSAGTVLLVGTGRGGTTWLSQIINHDQRYRYMFEPVMPDHVPLFAPLSRRPYLPREAEHLAWSDAMDRVVSGRLRNAWVDAHNQKLYATRRLVKDIRLNLALPWLANRYPKTPMIWLLRHPCAVAHSKIKLGWDTHLDLFLNNERLMADHLSPFRSLMQSATEPWDRHLLMWCVETFVPQRSLRAGETLPVHYEGLCDQPWEEVDRLFAYLDQPYCKKSMRRALTARSATHREGSAINTGADPVCNWMPHISAAQKNRADEILAAFGLDSIYTADDPRPRCGADDVIGSLRQAG